MKNHTSQSCCLHFLNRSSEYLFQTQLNHPMFLPKRRHDREYFGVAFSCRENKSSSMRRLTFNSCCLLANIKCNRVCIFCLRITAFFLVARKIRSMCRLAASADSRIRRVYLLLLETADRFDCFEWNCTRKERRLNQQDYS